jgi:dihydroneopterin aldolase
MPDVLEIHGLRLRVHLGMEAEERNQPQAVEVDVRLETDFSQGPSRDVTHGLVDYFALSTALEQTATAHPYPLLEALCSDLAARTLQFPFVERVQMRVTKHPASMPNVSGVTAWCERSKTPV